MEAMEELTQLSQSMMQAAALLADEDVDESSPASSKRSSTFLNVVALGNVVSWIWFDFWVAVSITVLMNWFLPGRGEICGAEQFDRASGAGNDGKILNCGVIL